jgi:hypothetical protein
MAGEGRTETVDDQAGCGQEPPYIEVADSGRSTALLSGSGHTRRSRLGIFGACRFLLRAQIVARIWGGIRQSAPTFLHTVWWRRLLLVAALSWRPRVARRADGT